MLAQPIPAVQKASLVQGVAQLGLLLSALTRGPTPLYWNRHICCNSSEAEIVFLPALTETDCAVGALKSDVISQRPESERCLESRLLSSYAMPQVAEKHRKGRTGKSKEYRMSGIRE